ncbi:MAG: hypothetical protein EOO70_05135 [Myxococcaceae bacterium]|nr:MAG: hypothetical protein EOO70_05135 [Myxococcaceae bacterium]
MVDQRADTEGVYDFDDTSVYLASYSSNLPQVVRPPSSEWTSVIFPYRWGRYLAAVSYRYPDGAVTVWDQQQGLLRTFLRYHQEKGTGDGGVYRVAVNDQYVFWLRDRAGLFRADLVTGETRQLSTVAPICDRLSALPSGLLCSTGQVIVIDQETGQTRALDPTSALQMDGAASNDRSQVVWIDYRDPPGPTGTADALRGGEVYLHTLGTGETRRLTFDSPKTPRLKMQPYVDGDWVVWSEMPEDLPPTTEWASAFYGSANRLVRLSLTSGQKCRLAGWGGGRVTLHQHHLHIQLASGPSSPVPDQQRYLVDLDLDHPDLPWKCE